MAQQLPADGPGKPVGLLVVGVKAGQYMNGYVWRRRVGSNYYQPD